MAASIYRYICQKQQTQNKPTLQEVMLQRDNKLFVYPVLVDDRAEFAIDFPCRTRLILNWGEGLVDRSRSFLAIQAPSLLAIPSNRVIYGNEGDAFPARNRQVVGNMGGSTAPLLYRDIPSRTPNSKHLC